MERLGNQFLVLKATQVGRSFESQRDARDARVARGIRTPEPWHSEPLLGKPGGQ